MTENNNKPQPKRIYLLEVDLASSNGKNPNGIMSLISEKHLENSNLFLMPEQLEPDTNDYDERSYDSLNETEKRKRKIKKLKLLLNLKGNAGVVFKIGNDTDSRHLRDEILNEAKWSECQVYILKVDIQDYSKTLELTSSSQEYVVDPSRIKSKPFFSRLSDEEWHNKEIERIKNEDQQSS